MTFSTSDATVGRRRNALISTFIASLKNACNHRGATSLLQLALGGLRHRAAGSKREPNHFTICGSGRFRPLGPAHLHCYATEVLGRVLVTPPSCTTSSYVVFSLLLSKTLRRGYIGCVATHEHITASPPEHNTARHKTKAHCLPSN